MKAEESPEDVRVALAMPVGEVSMVAPDDELLGSDRS